MFPFANSFRALLFSYLSVGLHLTINFRCFRKHLSGGAANSPRIWFYFMIVFVCAPLFQRKCLAICLGTFSFCRFRIIVMEIGSHLCDIVNINTKPIVIPNWWPGIRDVNDNITASLAENPNEPNYIIFVHFCFRLQLLGMSVYQ